MLSLVLYISTKNTLGVKKERSRTIKRKKAWIKRSEIKMGDQGLYSVTADGNKI